MYVCSRKIIPALYTTNHPIVTLQFIIRMKRLYFDFQSLNSSQHICSSKMKSNIRCFLESRVRDFRFSSLSP